jgi:hypothetical protein
MTRFTTAALLFVFTACAQPGLETRVQALEVEADRQAVIRLIHAYTHGIDSMDEALPGLGSDRVPSEQSQTGSRKEAMRSLNAS